MKRTVTLCCVFLTLLAAAVCAQEPGRPAPASAESPAAPPDHGGRIETNYDGFARETIVALRRMSVTCEAAKGLEGRRKNFCVSLQASLHCPGKQLDYVRHARLRLTFKAKDWDSRHPPDERDLTAVAGGETLRLGRMRLASQKVGEGWLDEESMEVLEVDVPYGTFLKLARAAYVEMAVGRTAFALREKNVAALRDLNSRVSLTRRESGTGARAGGN